MSETTTVRFFQTDDAGMLSYGDLFEYQPSLTAEDGARWKVYKFRGHITAASGEEWITCYGGDPDPKGDRAWRSFHVTDIKAGARPVRPAWREKEARP